MPSSHPMDLVLDQPTLVVVPWYDEVVDAMGFDPRSTYVELFWLNVLGPTATWLMRRMVSGLDEYPGGYELDLAQTAGALGLTFAPSVVNPFSRALNRCVMFGGAQTVPGGLAVRRRLPPVSARQLARMPPYLRDAHEAWPRRRTTPAGELARAQIFVEAMRAAGDPPEAVERQLLGLGVPPDTAMRVAIGAGH